MLVQIADEDNTSPENDCGDDVGAADGVIVFHEEKLIDVNVSTLHSTASNGEVELCLNGFGERGEDRKKSVEKQEFGNALGDNSERLVNGSALSAKKHFANTNEHTFEEPDSADSGELMDGVAEDNDPEYNKIEDSAEVVEKLESADDEEAVIDDEELADGASDPQGILDDGEKPLTCAELTKEVPELRQDNDPLDVTEGRGGKMLLDGQLYLDWSYAVNAQHCIEQGRSGVQDTGSIRFDSDDDCYSGNFGEREDAYWASHIETGRFIDELLLPELHRVLDLLQSAMYGVVSTKRARQRRRRCLERSRSGNKSESLSAGGDTGSVSTSTDAKQRYETRNVVDTDRRDAPTFSTISISSDSAAESQVCEETATTAGTQFAVSSVATNEESNIKTVSMTDDARGDVNVEAGDASKSIPSTTMGQDSVGQTDAASSVVDIVASVLSQDSEVVKSETAGRTDDMTKGPHLAVSDHTRWDDAEKSPEACESHISLNAFFSPEECPSPPIEAETDMNWEVGISEIGVECQEFFDQKQHEGSSASNSAERIRMREDDVDAAAVKGERDNESSAADKGHEDSASVRLESNYGAVVRDIVSDFNNSGIGDEALCSELVKEASAFVNDESSTVDSGAFDTKDEDEDGGPTMHLLSLSTSSSASASSLAYGSTSAERNGEGDTRDDEDPNLFAMAAFSPHEVELQNGWRPAVGTTCLQVLGFVKALLRTRSTNLPSVINEILDITVILLFGHEWNSLLHVVVSDILLVTIQRAMEWPQAIFHLLVVTPFVKNSVEVMKVMREIRLEEDVHRRRALRLKSVRGYMAHIYHLCQALQILNYEGIHRLNEVFADISEWSSVIVPELQYFTAMVREPLGGAASVPDMLLPGLTAVGRADSRDLDNDQSFEQPDDSTAVQLRSAAEREVFECVGVLPALRAEEHQSDVITRDHVVDGAMSSLARAMGLDFHEDKILSSVPNGNNEDELLADDDPSTIVSLVTDPDFRTLSVHGSASGLSFGRGERLMEDLDGCGDSSSQWNDLNLLMDVERQLAKEDDDLVALFVSSPKLRPGANTAVVPEINTQQDNSATVTRVSNAAHSSSSSRHKSREEKSSKLRGSREQRHSNGKGKSRKESKSKQADESKKAEREAASSRESEIEEPIGEEIVELNNWASFPPPCPATVEPPAFHCNSAEKDSNADFSDPMDNA
eukprot:Lankesteria_metandrocarpae@DN4406_c0_g1_i1.p1